MKSGEEHINSLSSQGRILNAIVEFPVLLEEIPSGQSTCGEETKRYGGPELGLDTPACCRTEQGDTASQREL